MMIAQSANDDRLAPNDDPPCGGMMITLRVNIGGDRNVF